MTEVEWVRAIEPAGMLEFLHGSGRATARQFLLTGVGFCRQHWPRFPDELRHLAKQVEAFADGKADLTPLEGTRIRPGRRYEDWEREIFASACGELTEAVTQTSGWWADVYPIQTRIARVATRIADAIVTRVRSGRPPLDYRSLEPDFFSEAYAEVSAEQTEQDDGVRAEIAFRQVAVIHDVFGNPYRDSLIEPSWLTPTVIALAQFAYKERAFDRLPILADALEEAGCEDDGILTHCRHGGPHVRGCWVIDRLLGKR